MDNHMKKIRRRLAKQKERKLLLQRKKQMLLAEEQQVPATHEKNGMVSDNHLEEFESTLAGTEKKRKLISATVTGNAVKKNKFLTW